MRAKPHNLCMAESVPFGQQFNYFDDIPVKEAMNPEFFLSVRNQFRPGDRIRTMQVVDGRVREYADLIVVQTNRDGIETRPEGPIHKIPAAKAEAAQPVSSRPLPVMFWKKGFGCFQALDAKGAVIAEMPTRADVFLLIEEKTGKPPVKWRDEAA